MNLNLFKKVNYERRHVKLFWISIKKNQCESRSMSSDLAATCFQGCQIYLFEYFYLVNIILEPSLKNDDPIVLKSKILFLSVNTMRIKIVTVWYGGNVAARLPNFQFFP